MNTIKIPGFIVKNEYGTYHHAICDMSEYGYITVCPHDIEIPMPAEFNPVAAEVSMLEKKLNVMANEHAQKVKQIKDRIANLLCIEYTPGDTA